MLFNNLSTYSSRTRVSWLTEPVLTHSLEVNGNCPTWYRTRALSFYHRECDPLLAWVNNFWHGNLVLSQQRFVRRWWSLDVNTNIPSITYLCWWLCRGPELKTSSYPGCVPSTSVKDLMVDSSSTKPVQVHSMLEWLCNVCNTTIRNMCWSTFLLSLV